MTYLLIKKLIESGKTYGLLDKVDVFYACGRLTESEYTELVGLLGDSSNADNNANN